MATVTIVKRPRKTGFSYVVNYVDPDTKRKKYHGTFRKWKNADKERTDLKTLLEGGELPTTPTARNINHGKTFGEIASLCREEWERRVKEGSLVASTLEGYSFLLAFLLERWGNRQIGTITEKSILDLRADLAAKNSPASSNRHLFVIKQVFKRATQEKATKHDPAKGIGILNEKQHERKSFLLPHELDKLLKEAERSRAKHYLPLAILLSVEHGCSRQEILDLTWKDINFDFEDTGLIRFYRTKNKRERLQRIMPRTREALLERLTHLEKRRKGRGIKAKGGHVVGHLDGTRMGDFNNAWKTVCKACGFDDLHFHDNRHTFCTNILLAGGSLKHAGAMIGHKDLRMTNRYTNLEGLVDNPIQGMLADHYENGQNQKRTHLGHKAHFRPKTTKKGSQVKI